MPDPRTAAATTDRSATAGGGRKVVGVVLMVANVVLDLLLPTVVLVALAPTGLPAAVRLAIGGTLLSGKAIGGQVGAGGFRWRPALVAAVVPAAAIGVGYAAGLGTVPSMVLGAVLSGVIVLGDLLAGRVRGRAGRGIDAVAVGVLIEVLAGVVLTTVSGDARYVLARTSIYLAIAGAVILATTWGRRPVMRTALQPVAAKGDQVRFAAFDRCWAKSRPFRGLYRWMTFSLGAVFLADAVLRVVIIYSEPASAVTSTSITSQLPLIVLLVVWFAGNRGLAVPRAERILDAELAEADRSATEEVLPRQSESGSGATLSD